MRRFWHSFLAVLLGNAIYLVIEPFLPERDRHALYQLDWGLVIDFWFCLACYGLLARLRWFRQC